MTRVIWEQWLRRWVNWTLWDSTPTSQGVDVWRLPYISQVSEDRDISFLWNSSYWFHYAWRTRTIIFSQILSLELLSVKDLNVSVKYFYCWQPNSCPYDFFQTTAEVSYWSPTHRVSPALHTSSRFIITGLKDSSEFLSSWNTDTGILERRTEVFMKKYL